MHFCREQAVNQKGQFSGLFLKAKGLAVLQGSLQELTHICTSTIARVTLGTWYFSRVSVMLLKVFVFSFLVAVDNFLY